MIELKNVTFAYNQEETLRDVSLTIPKGQVILFCGESGSGKTTITRLINGLIPHYFSGDLSGKIKVKNWETKKTNIEDLSDIVGSVFQNPRTQFFNSDTDSEIVFGMENQGMKPADIINQLERAAEELNLQGLRGRNIFELSAGEKQKIAFASAYAPLPEILVLDEPSSNLDFKAIIDLKNLLKKAKRIGFTIVIAEHRLWYLLDVIDRVVFMRKGQIMEDFTTSQFKSISFEVYKKMGLRCRNLKEIDFDDTDTRKGEEAFSVEELSVHVGKKEIIKKLSFHIFGGQVIGITGNNGAGKTTLARTLCGLQKFVGNICLENIPLKRKRLTELSYLVMQDVGHQLFSESVEEECKLGLKNIEEGEINPVLESMGLAEYKERHPLSLSGGQKQRLAISISLLCEKKIIVFDEPTSGLDLDSMKKVSKLIGHLAEKGKLIFVITHDNELIANTCSRILNLEDGKITKDLKRNEFGTFFQELAHKS